MKRLISTFSISQILRSFTAALLITAPLLFTAPALAGNITTVVGTGAAGYAGDNGPALAALLNGPYGIAVAPNGTIYFADNANYRIRSVSPAGIISTIAGTGNFGDAGDGGLAINAELSGVLSIALNPAADGLYIADVENNRVRRVDLTSGIIANFAGTGIFGFGYGGDGGPATNASLAFPEGVAVGPDGSVYIADVFNCVIRKVDPANIITTFAGNGACVTSGDSGDALLASFSLPTRVSVDGAGNLFVIDGGPNTIRRIDQATNQITRVAGGGINIPGFGAATGMNLGGPFDLVTDAAGQLYISNYTQLFKVDLASGVLSIFAGTGVAGFGGDGGPATAAQFQELSGLAFTPAGALLVGDVGNNRIRSIAPDIPIDVVLSLLTSQSYLDSLLAVVGNIALINVGGRELLVIPNMTSVGLNLTITGNDQLLIVDLNDLQSVGGSINISGNLAMTTLDLGALTTVGGSLTLTNDPSLSAILISGVTSIGGNLTLVGTAATAINVASLNTVSGAINISDNQSAGAIDVSSLTTVSGGLEISGNTSAAFIDVGALTTVAGGLTINDNTLANPIDVSALTTVSGGLNISGNTSAGELDLSTLTDVGGAINVADNASAGGINFSGLVSAGGIDITGNGSASFIDVSSLTTVSGDITIANNGNAAINVSAGTTVSGNVTIETTGSGTFDVGDGVISGGISLNTTGYTDVSGTTAGGATNLTNTTPDAVMRLQIQAATFNVPVSFAITHLGPAALAPEAGLAADGGPATIDPITGYLFTFGVPTLNHDANLSFDVNLAGLDAAAQAELLAAVAAGSATLATRSDIAGSAYQSFPVCSGGGSGSALTSGGCVTITLLDANGVVIPAGDPTIPTLVRFAGIVGHFSTWSVVIATPLLVDVTPPVFSNVPADIIAEATGPNGAVVGYTLPTAIDALSGPRPVSCNPASGATFALGATSVSCSAADAAGNSATAGFSVTVRDTTPPAISGIPANINLTAAAGAGGASATWSAPTASDLVSGSLPVSCLPASGFFFPLGSSSVSCLASDGAANIATASFSVTVQAAPPPPVGQIRTLYTTLGTARLLDLDTFAFQGVKGEKVTVRLAVNPAGTSSGSNAVLTLLGNGVLKIDNSALPNVVTVTLPKTGTYYVTVSETLKSSGRFKGAYGVSLESTLNAYSTFVQK